MKFFKKRLTLILILFTLFVGGCFLFPEISAANSADPNEEISVLGRGIFAIVGLILGLIVKVLGYLLVVITGGLTLILDYSNYTTNDAVVKGWKIVLDLCNMFFILILLVIAFATILRRESYSAKQLLGKLLIAAVLINFSKTICGLILEFAQVLMYTFTNSIAEGRFFNMLGVQNYLEFVEDPDTKTIDQVNALSGMIFAFLFLLVAIAVMLIMLAIMVMRTVMIWIYVVLSPLAFLLATFPAGQQYAQKWWTNFTQQVVTGPVLAFFIWLSFSVSFNPTTSGTGKELCSKAAGTQITCLPNFMEFVTSVAFLIGGVIITQQMGGMAGSAAGATLGLAKKGGMAAAGKVPGVQKYKDWRERVNYGKEQDKSAHSAKNIQLAEDQYVDKKLYKEGKSNISKRLLEHDLSKGTKFQKAKAHAKQLVTGEKDIMRFDKRKADNIAKKAEKKKEEAKRHENFKNEEYTTENGVTHKKSEQGTEFNQKEFEKHTMTSRQAAIHEAKKEGTTTATALKNQNEEKRVNTKQQEHEAAGTSPEMLRKILNDKNSSETDKTAAALTLAVKEGFKTKEDVSAGREAIGNNAPLLKKFNDEVDKNQAHLGYNFDKPEEEAKFNERHAEGKIKASSVLKSGDEKAMLALQTDMPPANFTAAYKEAYKAANKKQKAKMDKTMLKHRVIEETTGVTGTPIKKLKKDDKFSSNHAKITGRYNESFATGKDGAGAIDHEALGKFIASGANATALSDMDDSMFNKEDFMKVPEGSPPGTPGRTEDEFNEFIKTIGKNMKVGNMKALAKNDNVSSTVKEALKKAMKDNQSNNQKTMDTMEADQAIAAIEDID